jgi:hypothetical protein
MKKNVLLTILFLSTFCLRAQAQNAPVTTAPFVTGVIPGNVNVPVTVEDFSNIGALSLKLLYNPFVLTFQGATPNAAFNSASFSVTSSPESPGINKITISYPFGNPPVTLADGSTMVALLFTYTLENGLNYSELTWSDDGTSCEYRDASNVALTDTPTADFYHNGLIASQVAPTTFLPFLDFYTSGPFQLPVSVNNLTNIATIALTFEYDPSVITYNSIYSSPVTGLTLSDGPGTGGNRKIVIGYFGDPVSLANGSQLVSIGFNYLSGYTNLQWYDNGMGSCEYGDAMSMSLFDSPTSEYYKDGLISSTPAPRIEADTMAGTIGNILTVPVSVLGFENINSMFLSLDYNETVLVYQCATIHPDLEGDFAIDDSETGRLVISWSSLTEKSLPDECILMYLSFVYNGGTTALSWDNTDLFCQFTTGPLYTVLTDTPTNEFYFNGLAEAAGGPVVWTGAVSSDWNLEANWQDVVKPESFFDVVINAGNNPPNWPVFTGNFAIGLQCRNLEIQGAAHFTVTGDMIVEPGLKLKVTGNGALKVGGDWINNGTFDPGSGTVEFYGVEQGEIPAGVTPGYFMVNYGWSSFTAGMTALVSPTPGPSGDNAHSDVNIGFSFKYLGVSYIQARINTNGWLSLNLSGEDLISDENEQLFYRLGPNTVLAPWWDDLTCDGSTSVSYKTTGSAPSRIFTVEWKNILAYSTVATARLNFQVKLYETTNIIEYCYGTAVPGDHNNLEGASIGINDGVGGSGGCTIEGTTGKNYNIITCLVSNSNWPSVNYRFTPPATIDKEIFNKITISKTSNAKLRITRDTHVIGMTP